MDCGEAAPWGVPQLVLFKIPYKESPKQPICQMEI